MRTKNRIGKREVLSFPLLALLLFLAGQLLPAQTAAAGNEAWQQELIKAREQKDVEFKTSATSPMAGSARLTVPAAEKTFIIVRGGDVSASGQAVSGAVFALSCKQGKWFWDHAAPGIECRQGERHIAKGTEALLPGCVFSAGRLSLGAYPGPDALALIVFDPQRPQRVHFEHLLYFPPNRRYAVRARLEKFAEQRPVKIITTRKLEKTFYRYGRVHFQLQGKDLELTALKSSLEGPDAGYLFIPFKDMTNSKETYEVGRFLDVPEPAQGEFILDFNNCYNPLCNYSPAYNCPLPPLENFLDVEVPAGEKTYPH
jgi:uncharacterized protein (DUF1684 family)